MPIMDGNTLCAKLKNNIRTNMIPVVLLTAKSSEEEKLEGLETGADAYIVKPFNLDILRRTLLNFVASRNIMRNKIVGMESQENKVENLEMQTADDKLMEKVMKVINANMNNADLSIDYIAKEVGLSRVHFYRKMKTLTNQSPHNFYSTYARPCGTIAVTDCHEAEATALLMKDINRMYATTDVTTSTT